ncbi:cell division control protein 4 [Mycena epipterygia]|nr:cell division control protein 4 [Mycena epipterygia]
MSTDTADLEHRESNPMSDESTVWTSWINNPEPKHISFPAHGSAVVTCLVFSQNRIISASDDHHINVYCPFTGKLLHSLDGHEGGIWALALRDNMLVSGSTDRTLRIWDLETGRCTHIFGGHASTVRCLAIVEPAWVDVVQDDGSITKEEWPKRPLIITGGRDHTLRIWTLPGPLEPPPEYRYNEMEPAENPLHKLLLEGHTNAVRDLAAHGRTAVSASFDCTVRVWDIISGECKWVLAGHTGKVYSVVLDPVREQAYSGSMDGTVRIWNLRTGECCHALSGHTSLVGLLSLSSSHLVSAAADATLRHTGAITCFQHDEFKVLSGADGTLMMWDIRDGTVVRKLLTGLTGIWQLAFEGGWCVAVSNRQNSTVVDVWDFGNENDARRVGDGEETLDGKSDIGA